MASMGAVERISKVPASGYKPSGHCLSLVLLNLHAADLLSPIVVVMMETLS